MSEPMTATQLTTAFDLWGVNYRETPGWRTRNRNGHGGNERHGLLLHHTGTSAPVADQIRLLTEGRSDLPGPLCSWGMTPSGIAVLISNGRSNHAGSGSASTLEHIMREDYPIGKELHPGRDGVDGNAHLYGQETMYDGSKPMSTKALLNTLRAFAAVCDFHGWTAASGIGHREWTARKPDPGHLNMGEFRLSLRATLHDGPPKTAPKYRR